MSIKIGKLGSCSNNGQPDIAIYGSGSVEIGELLDTNEEGLNIELVGDGATLIINGEVINPLRKVAK